jgi:hypothetical protein
MKKRKSKTIKQLIEKHIMEFQSVYKSDPFHRYASWEKCYLFFKKFNHNRTITKSSIELASLHLAFFLASWGMYRGSSFLLNKSMDIHRQAVKEIMKSRYDSLWQICPSCFKDSKTLDLLFELKETLEKLYQKETKVTQTISETLITKIMLGTLGCTPAYDRFFKKGCKKLKVHICQTFNKKSINSLANFYKLHSKTFESVSNKIEGDRKLAYPPMKLVDMFLWKYGGGKIKRR